MAILVFTPKPQTLLKQIKEEIDKKMIDTWSYDSDGDLTHTPPQWIYKAWLRPSAQQGVLIFGLLGKKDESMTKQIYGIYHGRFAEMLLVHFDIDFSNVNITSQKDTVDNFK